MHHSNIATLIVQYKILLQKHSATLNSGTENRTISSANSKSAASSTETLRLKHY